MPQIYKDEGFTEDYQVITYTKQKYVLNREQATLVNDAINNGFKGRLQFKDFDIFIPNVADFYILPETRRSTAKQIISPENDITIPYEISPQVKERMKKIRRELEQKGVLKPKGNLFNG